MESRTKILGHPVHPMLIVFPLALLTTSLGFDIAYLASHSSRWADVSYWMIGIGIITGLIAAPFGFLDWIAIPRNTRARKIGALHGVGNVILLAVFSASWWLRHDNPLVPEATAIGLSFIGVLLSLVTGWLGGELVDRLGVGVDDNANIDAPSSLKNEPAFMHKF